jgi:hypothetical protein
MNLINLGEKYKIIKQQLKNFWDNITFQNVKNPPLKERIKLKLFWWIESWKSIPSEGRGLIIFTVILIIISLLLDLTTDFWSNGY